MKVGQMLKLGLVLAAFATAACVGLAFVYAGTAEVIAARSQADLEAALRELFPDADSGAAGFREISGAIESGVSTVTFSSEYEILRAGEIIGVAIRVRGPGFNGQITSLVGIGADGKITGAKILEHTDTPGLGANAASASYFVDKARGITFLGQYAGKSVTDPFEPKNDIVAITAATITSTGVSTAVRTAGAAGFAYIQAKGGN